MATGDLLSYCPETGEFRWRVSSGSKKAGDLAGGITLNGYWRIKAGRKHFYAHRLAWELYYGAAPTMEIDHINGNRSDNRIANLRLAEKSENQMNRRRHKQTKSGVKGVNWNPEVKKWVSRCAAKGKRIHIGYFDSLADAELAYKLTAKKMHGQFYSERL